MKEWKSAVAKFYIFAAFILMPLYYENGYFNTLLAKAHIYWITVGVALSAGLIIWIIEKFRVKGVGFDPVGYVKGFNMLDCAVASFGIVAALSTLFSSYCIESFTGSSGWNMGSFTLCTLALIYFYVSRNYNHSISVWLGLIGGADILYLLGFLNGLDIDPLSLHVNLTDSEHYEYIATVGNVNSYAGYLSLTIPVLAMLLVGNKRKWFDIFGGISMVLAYTNLYMANSDGAFLGVGFAFLFFIYYCLKDVNRYKGLLLNGLYFAIASVIVKLFKLLLKDDMIAFLGIPKKLIEYNLYLPIGVVCIVLLIFEPKLKAKLTEKGTKIISRSFATLAILAVAGVVGNAVMNFSGKWGSKRGWIWMFSMDLFADGSVKDKLIGVGPDCFGIPMMNNYGEFIEEHWGKRVANAHNEYIQYLITTGILGAASYLMLYISSFREFVKKHDWFEEKAAVFFGIIGYAGQAVVNNPQAMNMAIFVVFLAMYRSMKPQPEVIKTKKIKKKKKY